MTLARLRNLALSLQAWLIEADYDVELVGEEDRLRLNIHYFGFEYSKRVTPVFIYTTIPIVVHIEMVVGSQGYSSQWWIGQHMKVPPLSTVMRGSNLGWVMDFSPHMQRDALNTIKHNLDVLKADAKRDLGKAMQDLHEESCQRKRQVELQNLYNLGKRKLNRAIFHDRTPPPRPHFPTRKKYA